ncbi:MAG: hypothetical protein GY834_08260 [Bacteroidetes bacterium]|nr:hypothetical protein [Bacteroidota bacterium]
MTKEENIKNQARGLLVLIILIIGLVIYFESTSESKTPDDRLNRWYTVQVPYQAFSDKGVLEQAIYEAGTGNTKKLNTLHKRDGYAFLREGDKVKVLKIDDTGYPIHLMKIKLPHDITNYWTSQEAIFLGSRYPDGDDSSCFIRGIQWL